MKNKKSSLLLQRHIIEKKLKPWTKLLHESPPRAGWIKAIRGALGMTTSQLAHRMKIDQASVVRLEAREARGAVTMETLERAARAMNCKLIYALVPDKDHLSLNAILNKQAQGVATEILKQVSHSMSLEDQAIDPKDKRKQLLRIIEELKENVDSRLWKAK